jgi:FKBP-type peptidyl-prolyl cis-trans isomerase FklB
MKKATIILACAATLGSTSLMAQSKKALKAELASAKQKLSEYEAKVIPKQDLTTYNDSLSYALGADLYINNIAAQGLDAAIVADAFYLGFRDGEKESVSMENADREQMIQAFFAELNAKKQAEERETQGQGNAMAEANLIKGQAFLAENAKVSGVKTLASGLQYKVIKAGDAKSASPTAASSVTVNYEGKLIDGKVFDSSYERGTPATFPVGGVIRGWTEILQLMHKGDKWEVYIPADLAYGAGGNGRIAPNETLIFIVELLEVN